MLDAIQISWPRSERLWLTCVPVCFCLCISVRSKDPQHTHTHGSQTEVQTGFWDMLELEFDFVSGSVLRPHTALMIKVRSGPVLILEGHYLECFSCLLASTHLIQCVNNLFMPCRSFYSHTDLNQVFWSTETAKACRMVAHEDQFCTPQG